MNTISFHKKNVKMIAHRGLSGIEKENPCSAFVAAGNRSYFGIETDVHVTADGKYIVIHDENTDRVAQDCVEVEKSTFDTLRKIRLADQDGVKSRIDLLLPSLTEYISICKKYEKTAVLELKNYMEPEHIAGIVEEIRSCGYLDRVIFISFCLENLIALRALLPEQPAQYLIEGSVPADLLDTLARYRLGLDLQYDLLTPALVEAVHALGQQVNVWTVNLPEEGEALAEMGADMITSNILE